MGSVMKVPEGAATASGLAQITGLKLDEVYRRLRLDGAPTPLSMVNRIRCYEISRAVAYLSPPQVAV